MKRFDRILVCFSVCSSLGFTSSANAATFYSYRLFTGPGLPVGTDLRQAGLLGAEKAFPLGKYLILLRSLNLPLEAGSNRGLSTNLKQMASILTPFKSNLALVLTAGGNLQDRQSAGTRLPDKFSEVQRLVPLQGPWSLWLDPDGSLARLAAPKAELGDRESWGGVSLIACVQDGKVTGTYKDYLLGVANSGRLRTVAERCTQKGVNPEQVALPFRGKGEADFTLRDEKGKLLEGRKQKGAYALLALPPEGAYPNVSPKSLYADAERILKIAKIPLYMVALPSSSASGEFQDASSVATSLRKSLEIPVFTDTTGNFVDRFSNYLGSPGMLILFGKQGQPLDSFAPNTGDFDLPNLLQQALLEYDLL